MKYVQKNKLWLGLAVFLVLSFHGYAVFLMRAANMQQVFYLEVLLGTVILIVAGVDAAKYYKAQALKQELLQCAHVVCRELGQEFGQYGALWRELGQEELEVAEHDVHVLEGQLEEQFALNCDLQDYIAAWFHEVKLPLSACMLMNEKISDAALRTAQKEQLEMIRQQLNGALLGCKVQSSLFDLHVCATCLLECVKTAVHNNQYFLIRHQFEIILEVEPVKVYTDPSWFVYVLDQLIQNAMKYRTQNPVLKIKSESQSKKGRAEAVLLVEDHGEGIRQSDIRRIFERGYTGRNHHNGTYKSTGMGLYMAAQIAGRLGHQITVESEYGVYTRFFIRLPSSNLTNL
ncbi:MAG: sensor histidine kinase [Eubacterium sp.]|nr:sensor histidine kinase [Eubacterium sp.]